MLSMQRAKKLGLFLSLVLVVAGCGSAGSSTKSAALSPSGPDGASAYPATAAAPPGEAPADSAKKSSSRDDAALSPLPSASAPASASAGASRSSRDKDESASRAPSTRPGLGTEWGEARTSRVHDVSFQRDSSRPFATASMFYNDRRGVDAMANLAATRETRRDVSTAGGAVSFAIKDASGNALEAIRAGDRTLVVGQAGQRYSVVLTNHTSHRFESVVTVDGLDVVNGQPGSMENRGYILLPFATLEIEGFRQSAASVASFRFASVAESYAATKSSGARNVGVIGAAFFAERGDAFIDSEDTRIRDTASPFPADPRFAQPPRR